jgi:hypothetical protein
MIIFSKAVLFLENEYNLKNRICYINGKTSFNAWRGQQSSEEKESDKIDILGHQKDDLDCKRKTLLEDKEYPERGNGYVGRIEIPFVLAGLQT